MWPSSRRTVLIVSEARHEPTLDSAFLQQPNIRLLNSFPDDQGLRLAKRKRPSLIIEDLNGDARRGFEFCKELRAHRKTRSIPLILVVDPSLHAEADAAEADALLDKPVVRRELFELVRKFLPMPKRRTQRVAINLRFSYRVDDRSGQAFSRDLSQSGAFIKCDLALPIGTRLEVEFSLPGCIGPICCPASVRSAPPLRGQFAPPGFGIEFEDMDEDDAQRVAAFIEHQNADH